MKRLEALNQKVLTDIMLQRKWSRMFQDEKKLVYDFIERYEPLDYNDFAEVVNRMFLSTVGWPQTRHAGYVQEILSGLAHTVPGFYGYTGPNRWVHPKDRIQKGGSNGN